MTSWELAWGWLPGHEAGSLGGRAARTGSVGLGPRAVLEALFADLLASDTCHISFSGGRDSALLLAVATHVARTRGLPLPVPVTQVYPDHPSADERDWQDLVLRHLGLRNQVILTVRDQVEVASPIALEYVASAGGVIWPPFMYNRLPLLAHARGAALVTGEGGDEVLGTRRISPVRSLLGRKRRLRAALLAEAALALSPRQVRARVVRRQLPVQEMGWLTAAARARVLREWTADVVAEPLQHKRATEYLLGSRSQRVGLHNQEQLAQVVGCRLVHPLVDPRFARALQAEGGTFGWGGRTQLLRRLAGDLLPEAVLSRTGKATFTAAMVGPRGRAAASAWTGAGSDQAWVDVDALKAEWLSPNPHALSLSMLQAAALAMAG